MTSMHTDAILPPRRMPLPVPPHHLAMARASDPASDPTEAVGGLAPIDQVRQNVAAALFGAPPSITQVGRFQIQKLLGAGGMGVVFAAHDPQLGRTVAIKLLQPMTSSERARERLQREAQAMARLQHPNVVGVYETGIHGDQVFVAMEFVEGGTFGDWLRVRPRPWTDVVDMLCQAGDGLAAAHQVGLVHRDFKPANILMSGTRARISDFGLARPAAEASELERTSDDDGLLLASPLTRTGALLGTPAYMAPELLHGAVATPASDQFAFGVVLHEACHGHRPFVGDSVPALLDAIESGKPATSTAPIPPSLTAIIRRALDRDPARRFPDMPALLTSLRAVRARRGIRPGLLGLAFGLRDVPNLRAMALMSTSLALVGGLSLAALSEPSDPDLAIRGLALSYLDRNAGYDCQSPPLAAIWSATRRGQLAAILPAHAVGLLPALDDYAAQWQTRHAARCAASEAPQAPQWADSCLADRRHALADLVHAIFTSDAHGRARAHLAPELLPALADCDAPTAYTTLVSEAPIPLRLSLWRVRLATAETFQPRAATRPALVDPPRSALTVTFEAASDFSEALINLGNDDRAEPRARVETLFVLGVHELRKSLGLEPGAPVTGDPHTLAPLARLRSAGEAADAGGFADLAARAWVLAAEVLEAGPHADDERDEVWTSADAALARLPAAHPLRLRLQRDLGYIALTHARHVTPKGACFGDAIDFAGCADLFTTTRRLHAIARDPAADDRDRELLARAHDWSGNTVAATVARGGVEAIALDEAALGYLDFGRAELVAPTASLADQVRCDLDATICEVDRAFVDRDAVTVPGAVRIMHSVKDGLPRGLKVYGIRPDTAFKALGFKNGDLILDLAGAPVDATSFLPAFQDLLKAGGATLRVERKGEVLERRFVVK